MRINSTSRDSPLVVGRSTADKHNEQRRRQTTHDTIEQCVCLLSDSGNIKTSMSLEEIYLANEQHVLNDTYASTMLSL